VSVEFTKRAIEWLAARGGKVALHDKVDGSPFLACLLAEGLTAESDEFFFYAEGDINDVIRPDHAFVLALIAVEDAAAAVGAELRQHEPSEVMPDPFWLRMPNKCAWHFDTRLARAVAIMDYMEATK